MGDFLRDLKNTPLRAWESKACLDGCQAGGERCAKGVLMSSLKVDLEVRNLMKMLILNLH